MTATPRLALPELSASQASKHVTHNDALIQLDAMVSLYFLAMNQNTPPGSPSDGDTYQTGGSPTGAWAGYSGKIAYLIDGSWRFYTPFNGLRGYNAADSTLYVYESGTWNSVSAGGGGGSTTRASILAAPIEAMADLVMNENVGMEVSQENGASSVTLTGTGSLQTKYIVDGVMAAYRGSFVATAQQVTDAPKGFKNSVKLTIGTAESSLGVNDELSLLFPVEGYQAARLAFGASNPNCLAVFFWVKAHRTGSYSGSLRNGAKARSYPFSFTISAADTWEFKTVFVGTGDASGTWAIDNSVGLYASICVAGGSSRLGTAATWAGSDLSGVTGSTNGVAATSDVFQMTGFGVLPMVNGASFADVPDSAHSPFLIRPFPKEILRARRFYQDVCRASGGLAAASFLMQKSTTFTIDGPYQFAVPMRQTPTLKTSSPAWAGASPSGNQLNFYDNAGGGFVAITGALTVTTSGADTPSNIILRLQAATSFGGTIGDVGNLYLGASAWIACDARL